MKKSFINNALLLVSAQYVSILHKINNGEDDTRHSQVPLAPDSYISQCLEITENGLIQHCERSELRLHFEWTKVFKIPKMSILASF